ncbi:TPA: hypothetical protein ACH3X1_014532 [Trebouxia sp. C0004]
MLTTRLFEPGTSITNAAPPATAVALQPWVQWADLVVDDVLLNDVCLIEDTFVSNESFTSHTDGADLTGDEMMSELIRLSSSPPSPDAKCLLDRMRLLEDTPTNTMAEMAFNDADSPTDGEAGDIVSQANQPHSRTGALTPEDVDNGDKSQLDMCPLPFTVWFGEVAGEVMEVYKEAGALASHTLAPRLHSACRHCAANLAEAIIILKFLWKELCGDCRHAVRTLTGNFSAVVMGCELVVLLLVASVVWMIRCLLLLEKQWASFRLSNDIRHNASLKNHCSHKRVTTDLESTTEGLKRGLDFAHHLLGSHHVRTGRRHKATKGSLSLLERQQVKARRQRLALKKQLRRALAQQTLLERQMERLQQILDVVLQVGRSLRNGSSTQAAKLLNLKNHLSEQHSLTGNDVHTLQQEMARLETQLRTEQRTQHLLESQGALIAELRSQLSAGQERQEGLITKVSSLEQAQAALQAQAAAGTTSSSVVVPLSGQAAGVSNGVGAGLAELDENGSVVMGSEEHGPSPLQESTGASSEDLDSLQALRSISQVETGRIPALKVHHDNRGDYGMDEVERSPLPYLSTTTTAPSTKTGSFSMPAAKARLFQQHDDAFSRINSNMDLGSPKGRRAPRVGNPFAPGLTPAASEILPVAQELTPAASQTLPTAELSAVSAATSSAPLLHREAGAASQAVQRLPVKRSNSMQKLHKWLRKLKPSKTSRI